MKIETIKMKIETIKMKVARYMIDSESEINY